MAQTRTRKRRARNRNTRVDLAPAVPRPAPRPVRGMKVRTVSALTLAFSLLCLAAFAASRPPLPSVRGIGTAATVTGSRAIAKRAKATARRAPTEPFGAPPTAR